MDLLAQVARSGVWVVTQGVTLSVLRHEDQELVIRHRQAELRVDIVIVLGSLITGTAGTVEGASSIDARGGDITAVLARNRIASTALGRRSWVRQCESGQGDQQGNKRELHSECGLMDYQAKTRILFLFWKELIVGGKDGVGGFLLLFIPV